MICRLDLLNGDYYLSGGGSPSTTFAPFAINVDITYDIKVVCDGVNVLVELYQNGVLQIYITYASSIGTPDRLAFEHYDMVWNTGAKSYYYSEVIVTDNEPTIGWRLATLDPAADGANTAWVGDYTDIQDLQDGLSISSGVAGEKESWTLSAYSGPATTSGVRAVVNKFLGSTGATGPSQITPFIRHAATDVDGATYPMVGGEPILEVLDINPQTTLGWDTADFATLEVGVKSVA